VGKVLVSPLNEADEVIGAGDECPLFGESGAGSLAVGGTGNDDTGCCGAYAVGGG